MIKPFTKVQLYGLEGYTYWISGIYKIVSYTRGGFNAYYIQDGSSNWGMRVDPGIESYPDLEQAKAACDKHEAKHNPKPRTIRRAAEILNSYLDKWGAAA